MFAAAALALGTPFFGWSTVFFAHSASGSLLLIAFAIAAWPGESRWRGAILGLLLGVLLTVDLTAAPARAIVAGYFLFASHPDRLRPVLTLGIGGLVGVLPLLVYGQVAFGSPFHLGYSDVVGFTGMKQGLFGLTTPNPGVLFEICSGFIAGCCRSARGRRATSWPLDHSIGRPGRARAGASGSRSRRGRLPRSARRPRPASGSALRSGARGRPLLGSTSAKDSAPRSGSQSGSSRAVRDGSASLDALDDVGCRGHELGALLDQMVAAFGPRIERRAGDGKDLAVLLERQPRRDQRARALGRLDHHDPERQTRDQPVAARKILRPRLPAHRHFGEQHAAIVEDRAGQRLCSRRDRSGRGRRRGRRRFRWSATPCAPPHRCRGPGPRRRCSRARRDRRRAPASCAGRPPRRCARRRSRPCASRSSRSPPMHRQQRRRARDVAQQMAG